MLQTLARRSVRPSLASRVQMQRRYLDYGHDMHKVRYVAGLPCWCCCGV